jgi:predicted chitinase
MLDFLTVYSATQKDGSWDSLKIGSTTDPVQQAKIRAALFGTGVKIGGLIDSSKVLLGGMATTLGSQMTQKSLAKVMVNNGISADWVIALQQAMAEFKINTPQRIAAFLAQVVNESTGLSKPVENPLRYTSANLRNYGLFRHKFTGDSGHRDAAGHALDWAGYLGTAANSTLSPLDRARMIADRQYNGGSTGNVVGTDDGWNFRGRGPLHLTGRANYTAFASYFGLGSVTFNKIMNTPDFMNNDFKMMARCAAWYWVEHPNQRRVNLNDKADNLPGIPDNVTIQQFRVISHVVATDTSSYPNRYNSYKNDIKFMQNGGNPYENMQQVLQRLGIKSTNAAGYEKQFGINLHVPTRQPIVDAPHLLLADTSVNPSDSSTSSINDPALSAMQSLLAHAQFELNLQPGEYAMLIPDMYAAPPQSPTIVMVAQTNQAQDNTKAAGRAIGVCELVENDETMNVASISAISSAELYIQEYEHLGDFTEEDVNSEKATILQLPKHGTLGKDTEPTLNGMYIYTPNKGYVGKDFAVVLVEIKGIKIKVFYYFHVLDHETTGLWNLECGKKGGQWKISQDANGNSVLTAVDYLPTLTGNSTSASDAAALAGTLGKGLAGSFATSGTSTSLSTGITLNIADLPGGAVGETTGTSITLDTNAAGYGWYIDPNPAANSDFLPTANPDVWMAKAGSAAAGKMDMLSVLLHEYGHALM